MILVITSLSLCFTLTTYQWLTNERHERKYHHPVLVKGRYGFIDNKGKLLFSLPQEVINVRDFSEGLAVVGSKLGERHTGWGYIDVSGKVVIQPKYERARSFSGGLAAVRQDGKWGFINQSGELIISFSFDLEDNEEIRFSEGLAVVRYASPPDPKYRGKYGYIDQSGNLAIGPQFSSASPFSEGLAIISIERIDRRPKRGYIDKEGEVIIQPQFTVAKDFSEGLAMVQVGEYGTAKVGYIDKTGKLVIAPQFDSVYDVIKTPNDVSKPLRYYRSGRERDFSEGMAAVKINEKWGYINKLGQIVIPTQFVYAGQFKEGLAAVALRKGNKRVYGFINKSGQFTVQPKYDDVKEFKHGLAAVFFTDSQGDIDAWGYIDKMGRYVWKPTK